MSLMLALDQSFWCCEFYVGPGFITLTPWAWGCLWIYTALTLWVWCGLWIYTALILWVWCGSWIYRYYAVSLIWPWIDGFDALSVMWALDLSLWHHEFEVGSGYIPLWRCEFDVGSEYILLWRCEFDVGPGSIVITLWVWFWPWINRFDAVSLMWALDLWLWRREFEVGSGYMMWAQDIYRFDAVRLRWALAYRAPLNSKPLEFLWYFFTIFEIQSS